MSLASLLGTFFGFALVFGSIFFSTNNYGGFVSLASVFMVLGGTTAAAFMSFEARYVMTGFKAIWWMIKKPKSSREGLNTEILRLVKWAYMVQTKGLPALENEIKKFKASEPLLRYMVEVVSSNYKPNDLRLMLETATESEFERVTVPVDVLKQMASAAPAFGMIGTLVGLIIMLQGLAEGGDLQDLGAGLSVALLTTLYGVIVARMIFLPAGLKLQQREEIERFRNYLIVEGLVMLAQKQSPRYMQDRLNSFLDPAIHFNIDKQISAADRAPPQAPGA